MWKLAKTFVFNFSNNERTATKEFDNGKSRLCPADAEHRGIWIYRLGFTPQIGCHRSLLSRTLPVFREIGHHFERLVLALQQPGTDY